MNELFLALGIESWKPVLAALLLPPVPWLLLMLVGARLLARRWRVGWVLVLGAALLEWASCTSAAADWVAERLLAPPPALDPAALAATLPDGRGSAIVVLGGGRTEAGEYGGWTLNPLSIERLRHGVWLARRSGLPLGFSGGLSPGARDGPSEGELAQRIARDELRHPLAWVESRSRDTRENAARTVELLRGQGLGRLVVVTHQLHLPRALRHFERERDAAGERFALLAAPVAVPVQDGEWSLSDFYPTQPGIARMRYALREWLGIVAGA